MIERVKNEREPYRQREWSKYLQLTDLSKWIRCLVSAVAVNEREERGSTEMLLKVYLAIFIKQTQFQLS